MTAVIEGKPVTYSNAVGADQSIFPGGVDDDVVAKLNELMLKLEALFSKQRNTIQDYHVKQVLNAFNAQLSAFEQKRESIANEYTGGIAKSWAGIAGGMVGTGFSISSFSGAEGLSHVGSGFDRTSGSIGELFNTEKKLVANQLQIESEFMSKNADSSKHGADEMNSKSQKVSQDLKDMLREFTELHSRLLSAVRLS